MIMPSFRYLTPLCLLLLGACGEEAIPAPEPGTTSVPQPTAQAKPAFELPTEIHIEEPETPVELIEQVEDSTEEVADRLLDLSDKLRRRDFTSVRTWFVDDFAGHGFANLAVEKQTAGKLETEHIAYRVSDAPVLGADDFTDSLQVLMEPWSRVESVLWKVKGAEFQALGAKRWGKIKLYVSMMGEGANNEPIAISGWGYARAVKTRGKWMLDRVQLTSLDETRRAAPIFTDVTAAAGVARTGIRFGQAGNKSFAWNGSASGDVDADGRWDIFSTGPSSNVLYIAGENGKFTEEAQQRGVASPGAGTGALFFDFENDGDQDLFVGQVGWREPNGKLGGQNPQAYQNDGKGQFSSVSDEMKLVAPGVLYSLTAFDYDNDGYLDVFGCGYGRVEKEHNNSWMQATNGSPNSLYHNLVGKGFEEVAESAGLVGTDWTYASAAADVDQDGDADLYLANDYGVNRMMRNDGNGKFTDVAEELGIVDKGNGMGVSFGDLDNDGALDLYVSNMSSTAGNRILGRIQDELDPETFSWLKKLAAGNSIFMSSDSKFTKLAKDAGGVGGNWAWTPALADYDLDGRLDIFCTNGFVTGDLPHDT
ncbi:MAG: hypothetical protein ACI8TQ_002602 [Planctomycetota bacterium]|jgi:hypothetical protein